MNICFYQTFITKSEDDNKWIDTVISILPNITIEINKKWFAIILHWLGFGLEISNSNN